MIDDFERALAHEQKLRGELITRLTQVHQNHSSTASELRAVHDLMERLKTARAACSRAAERQAAS
jgi:hypothetical protein